MAEPRMRRHHEPETTAQALFERARRLDQVAGFGYEMGDFLTDLVPFLASLEPRASDGEAVAHGLELAAKWHDQRAHDTPDAFETEFHQVSAAAIRKLSEVSHEH